MAVELNKARAPSRCCARRWDVPPGPVGALRADVDRLHQPIAFTNLTKAASKEPAAVVKPAIAKELSLNAWYAQGVGPIKVTADGTTQ
jgi:hypothetical protein